MTHLDELKKIVSNGTIVIVWKRQGPLDIDTSFPDNLETEQSEKLNDIAHLIADSLSKKYSSGNAKFEWIGRSYSHVVIQFA